MMPKNILLAMALILVSVKTSAQAMGGVGSGGIGISYSLQPERKFKSTPGGYKYTAFGMNARIPLFRKNNLATGHFFETSLQADLQAASANFGFVASTRKFTNGSLGLGAVIFNGGKNMYIINAAVGIAADNDVISKTNTRYRFSGAFIVNHQHSNTTLYQYGMIFTYSFGKPLPLPVLGIRTKLSSNWTFSTILPVELSFTNRINTKLGLSFNIRPAGNRYQFDNQANFSTVSSTVFMQMREFQLGAALNYKLSRSFSLGADAGFLIGGKLRFTEQDDINKTVFETTAKPGANFRLSLRYRLPRKMEGANKLQEILNPLGN
ncbi:MAG: DUF6268 family outer membrane beta-barrel protein [Bacteroidota bacterium]